MDTQEKQFLYLAVIKQKKYAEIEQLMGLNRQELSRMWDSLKEPREELSELLRIWKSKNQEFKEDEFEVFRQWTEKTPKECHYCKITVDQMDKLWVKDPKLTKRLRGKKLEIERIEPNKPYTEIKNLVYACYWCNNAKTDTFTHKEFIGVGKVFQKIWEDRLK